MVVEKIKGILVILFYFLLTFQQSISLQKRKTINFRRLKEELMK